MYVCMCVVFHFASSLSVPVIGNTRTFDVHLDLLHFVLSISSCVIE